MPIAKQVISMHSGTSLSYIIQTHTSRILGIIDKKEIKK